LSVGSYKPCIPIAGAVRFGCAGEDIAAIIGLQDRMSLIIQRTSEGSIPYFIAILIDLDQPGIIIATCRRRSRFAQDDISSIAGLLNTAPFIIQPSAINLIPDFIFKRIPRCLQRG